MRWCGYSFGLRIFFVFRYKVFDLMIEGFNGLFKCGSKV